MISSKALIAIILATAFAAPLHAQTIIPAQPVVPAETVDQIPFPVPSFLQFDSDGQNLRMAFFDLRPAGVPKGTALLLHGKNFASDYWTPAIAGLLDAGYRVIVPDQLGFGQSSKPDRTYTFELLAANTALLLDTLKITKVSVIGNSMGGMLAVHFARRYPDRVAKLILENPLGLENYKPAIPPQSNADLIKLEMTQTPESYSKFLHSYFPVWKPEYERFVQAFARTQSAADYPDVARASAQTYQMIYDGPIVDELPKLTMPTLLIIGQKDRTVFGRRFAPPEAIKGLGDFPALGKAAAKTIPNARLVEIPDSGHVPHLETPETFIKAATEFLAE